MSGCEWTPARVRCTRERVTGRSLVPSSFHDRFTKELARMFRAVSKELTRKIASTRILDGKVDGKLTKNQKKIIIKQ